MQERPGEEELGGWRSWPRSGDPQGEQLRVWPREALGVEAAPPGMSGRVPDTGMWAAGEGDGDTNSGQQ